MCTERSPVDRSREKIKKVKRQLGRAIEIGLTNMKLINDKNVYRRISCTTNYAKENER